MGCKLLIPSKIHSSDAVIQVSPIHTYFVAHLPKMLLSSTLLAAIGFLADSRLSGLVVQALSFVICLSFLGHKEWRFVIYVVPLLNVAAARGARALSVSTGSLSWFSLGISLTLFDMQRLAAERDAIWEALLRGVCCDAVRKFGVHSNLHLCIRGELPRRRFSRPIQ